jgi:phosphatidylethanolamine/phosphatidyl-N-methylethanolamine N-methyltransferase
VIDEAARFDKLAPAYDLSILPAELAIGRRRKRLLQRAHGDVLEIGIGTGRTLRFYPSDSRISGVDVSGEMLERARRRAAKLGRAVELRKMPADTLEFGDASFDAVVSSLVFCSVEAADRALREIRRVLRPGGELLMVEHIRPQGWLGRLFDWLDPWFYRQSCHVNRRTPEYVSAAGFDIVDEERWLRGVFASVRAIPKP